MDLESQLLPECIYVGLQAEVREDVLREIARLAAQTSVAGGLDAETIGKALGDREAVASTGVGHGAAIPHARLAELDAFLLGVVTLADGVDFGAADGQAVRLVVFMLGPKDRPDQHLRLLSTVSRVLDAAPVRTALLQATTVDEVRAIFASAAPRRPETEGEGPQSLLKVHVQVEEVFEELLEVMSSETASLAVAEVRDASFYLHAIPLYALLWEGEQRRFHRTITGVVEPGALEGLVQALQATLERHKVARGVQIIAHRLDYCSGRLDP